MELSVSINILHFQSPLKHRIGNSLLYLNGFFSQKNDDFLVYYQAYEYIADRSLHGDSSRINFAKRENVTLSIFGEYIIPSRFVKCVAGPD